MKCNIFAFYLPIIGRNDYICTVELVGGNGLVVVSLLCGNYVKLSFSLCYIYKELLTFAANLQHHYKLIPTIMHRVFVFLMSLILLVLTSCTSPGSYTAMRTALDSINILNRTDQPFTAADVQPYVDYFENYGNSNDRMLAHYLLGRAYHEHGEAPMALQCYQQAADCADTTSTDCDYAQLCRVYSQMSVIFYDQSLYSQQLQHLRNTMKYAWIGKDTLSALLSYEQQSQIYKNIGYLDSAIVVAEEVARYYCQYGYSNYGAIALGRIIQTLINQGEYEKAKDYIRIYETESGLFDDNGNIQQGREAFYHVKGLWYLKENRLDSAEYWFRKELCDGKDFNNQNGGALGLAMLYEQRHVPDSSVKYYQYAYAMNDSMNAQKTTETIERMQSMYDYSHYQKEALDNAEKAHVANIRFIVLAALLVLLAAGAAYFVKRNRKRREEQNARYHVAIVERNKLQKEVESLNAKDYESVITQKEQEIALLNQTIERQSTTHHRVTASDRLSDFEKSQIVQVFLGKRTYHKEQAVPTGNEWKELVSQFREDMPSAYATMSSLSPLQLQVCVLLILGFEEGEIAYLRQTKPQVINTAKVRANQKLFLSNDSASLKGNLAGIITP